MSACYTPPEPPRPPRLLRPHLSDWLAAFALVMFGLGWGTLAYGTLPMLLRWWMGGGW